MESGTETTSEEHLRAEFRIAIGAGDDFRLSKVPSLQSLKATQTFLQQDHGPNDFFLKRRIAQNVESLGEDAYLKWLEDMSLHYRYVSERFRFDWRSNTADLIRMIENLSTLRRRNPGITHSQERTVLIVSLSLLQGRGFRDVAHFYESSAMLKDQSFVGALLDLEDECHGHLTDRVKLAASRSDGSVRLAEVLSALHGDNSPVLSNGAL